MERGRYDHWVRCCLLWGSLQVLLGPRLPIWRRGNPKQSGCQTAKHQYVAGALELLRSHICWSISRKPKPYQFEPCVRQCLHHQPGKSRWCGRNRPALVARIGFACELRNVPVLQQLPYHIATSRRACCISDHTPVHRCR